jgi:predicted amidohydrolase YtcJ
MTTTLYRNGRVYSPADPAATALLVDDGGVIAWLGGDADAPGADETVDLGGALVTPAFVDAHVHATDTGITLRGLDLSGARSRVEVLDAVAAQTADVVLGHGFDESTWADRRPPSAAELDRAAGGRMVYLSQASVHSAVVSSALLTRVAVDAPGYDGTGWLRRDAHHVVRGIAHGSMPAHQRRDGQRAALRHAAGLGIAAVHECGGPGTSSEDDFTGLIALPAGEPLPVVFGYWGELGAAAKAKELGAVGAGGDLYADGALGSRTAHLREPYVDGAGSGFGYVTAGQVADHLVGCARAEVQGGFHAIGDAAIATVLAGFQAAADRVGVERLREGRHRIEHLEILDKELIRGLVEFGVTASVQPAFDRLWGGEDAMYAQCLGVHRSLESNPLGALAGVGVALAFGSDSPVTPLDPWGSVLAAMRHHNPRYRVGVKTAFAAHSRGGWRAVHDDASGVLAPGAPATLAVWDVAGGLVGGLPELEFGLPACRRTVLRGQVIYDVEAS